MTWLSHHLQAPPKSSVAILDTDQVGHSPKAPSQPFPHSSSHSWGATESARQSGKRLGRPATAAMHTDDIRKLHGSGLSKSEIARRLQIGRASVRHILDEKTSLMISSSTMEFL